MPNTTQAEYYFPTVGSVAPNATTDQQAQVTKLLEQAAYFPLFSIHNEAIPNKVNALIPWIPILITSVGVNEQLHRFQSTVESPIDPCGLKASEVVGQPVATVEMQWMPIPEAYAPAPTADPPVTLLNPFSSQRFTAKNGHFSFTDNLGSSLHGFGAGRTFPVSEGGSQRLRIGAAIDVLSGTGQLEGLTGALVVNGYIQPPQTLALSVMPRLIDPTGSLKALETPTPLAPIADPDPNAVIMFFLGTPDPDKPMMLHTSADGSITGATLNESLELIDIQWGLQTPQNLGTQHEVGPIVGSASSTLCFNPHSTTSVSPAYTTDGELKFWDRDEKIIGTLKVDMIEGRSMYTPLDDAPYPVFRLAGFGPIISGTGQLGGAEGMMTINSVISVFPSTFSHLYVFRFYDPLGRLHDACNTMSS